MKEIYTHSNAVAGALIEGREEGKELGREERNIEIARCSLQTGLDIEIIAKITGLAVDKIRNLN